MAEGIYNNIYFNVSFFFLLYLFFLSSLSDRICFGFWEIDLFIDVIVTFRSK